MDQFFEGNDKIYKAEFLCNLNNLEMKITKNYKRRKARNNINMLQLLQVLNKKHKEIFQVKEDYEITIEVNDEEENDSYIKYISRNDDKDYFNKAVEDYMNEIINISDDDKSSVSNNINISRTDEKSENSTDGQIVKKDNCCLPKNDSNEYSTDEQIVKEDNYWPLKDDKKESKIAERTFQCKTCGRMFLKFYNLATHERTHVQEKPYLCEYCGKSWGSKSNFNDHKKIHTTTEKLFKCIYCRKPFTQKPYLTLHMKKWCKQKKKLKK